MKSSFYLLLLVLVAGICACERYEYVPDPESLSGMVDGLRCGDTIGEKVNLSLRDSSKFYVFEVVNKGECKVRIVPGISPVNVNGPGVYISPGQHLVYIGDIPDHEKRDRFQFDLHCSLTDLGRCSFYFDSRICDKVEKGKDPHPFFAIDSSGEKTIGLNTGKDSMCLTSPGLKLELLVIENASKTDHEVTLTIESTCSCPEFHVDPISNPIPSKALKEEKIVVKKNSKVQFVAYCGGKDVVNPSCRGRIKDIKLRPKG